MLDLAMFSLAADMAQKAGIAAVVDYWVRVGETYAQRIGTETFVGWPQFNIASNERRTSLTVEGEVRVLTDMAITDPTTQEIIGYVYAVVEDPMVAVYNRWISIMGQAIPPIDAQIVEYYNRAVRATAVSSFDPCNQSFREEAARALSVGGSPLDCLHIASRSRLGERRLYQPTLDILGLEERYIVSLLRDHMTVYGLVESGKLDTSSYIQASAINPQSVREV